MIELTWTLNNDTPTEKVWLDQTGKYRVSWRSKFMGVTVIPKYFACELNDACWDIVSKHRELGPAQAACQKRARKRVRDEKIKVRKKRVRKTVERGSFFKKPKL